MSRSNLLSNTFNVLNGKILKMDFLKTDCTNNDPRLTLVYFTARSNLISDPFIWEKS